jgi:hypothetical protein
LAALIRKSVDALEFKSSEVQAVLWGVAAAAPSTRALVAPLVDASLRRGDGGDVFCAALVAGRDLLEAVPNM